LARQSPTDARATLLLFAIVVAVPSVTFWWLWSRFGFTLPPLNADFVLVYAAAILIARSLSRRLASALAVAGAALVFAVHLFLGLGFIYIDDPALIREYIGFAAVWPWRLILTYAAIGALFLIGLYLAVARIKIESAALWPAVPLILVLILLNEASDTPGFHRYLGANLVTSSTVRTAKLAHTLATKPGFTQEPLNAPSMNQDAEAFLKQGASILSISVESWGLAKQASFNEFILRALESELGGKYTIKFGSHPSKGGTLTGELRELCARKTAGTPTAADADEMAAYCLPNRLKQAGYKTLGIHGNSGTFYNRQTVYPKLGFTSALFLNDLIGARYKAPRCHHVAFDGVCDASAIAVAAEFTGGGQKSYAHVMTLDTHFPLAPDSSSDMKCAPQLGTQMADLCLYANQFAALMKKIGSVIAKQDRPPDVIFIFGDHPPPYAVAVARSYFHDDKVPYLTLVRRKGHDL
jgi:hypothetical protein